MPASTPRNRLVKTATVVTLSAALGSPLSAGEIGCCSADLMCQGIVDAFSALALLNSWGDEPQLPHADLNGDGTVDGWDLGYLLGHWGVCTEDLRFPTPTTIALEVDEVTSPEASALDLRTFDLFIPFGEPTDRLLNIFDADLGCDTFPCFVHATPFGMPAQSTPLSQPLIDGANVTWDTFVTIGSVTSTSSDVTVDLNFDSPAFTDGEHLGDSAGWFTFPSHPEGLAGTYADLRIRIARLTIPDGTMVTGQLTAMWQRADSSLHISTIDVVVGDPPSADLNGDGIVNGADLGILLSNWGQSGIGDLNFDGIVDGADLGILLKNWGPY